MTRGAMTMTVTGLDEIRQRLSGLKTAVQNRIVRGASTAALKPVVATARKGVPENTGNLRKSLGVKRVKKTRRGEFVFLVGPRHGFKWGDPVTETEHDPVRYGTAVEFGHILKVYGRPTSIFIPPAAFLRNAYNQHRVTLVDHFEAEVNARIDKHLARGA